MHTFAHVRQTFLYTGSGVHGGRCSTTRWVYALQKDTTSNVMALRRHAHQYQSTYAYSYEQQENKRLNFFCFQTKTLFNSVFREPFRCCILFKTHTHTHAHKHGHKLTLCRKVQYLLYSFRPAPRKHCWSLLSWLVNRKVILRLCSVWRKFGRVLCATIKG